MTTHEIELKALMLASLDGDAASHRALLDRLSRRLRAYYKGKLAIMPAGMMGDRAAVIFAAPEEINKLIEARC
jgi:hypothetical protein